MTRRDVLSPGMLHVLVTIRDGGHVDGRSWRAVDALIRRGLIANGQLTAAGREALAARLTINGETR